MLGSEGVLSFLRGREDKDMAIYLKSLLVAITTFRSSFMYFYQSLRFFPFLLLPRLLCPCSHVCSHVATLLFDPASRAALASLCGNCAVLVLFQSARHESGNQVNQSSSFSVG